MNVTVTGAAGRLGKFVCRHLTEAGLTVLGADRSLPAENRGDFEILNLTHREECYRLFRNCQAVVHLGNIPNHHLGDPQTVFNSNVASNMNVFQAAVEAGVEKIVFASSIQAIFDERFDGDVRTRNARFSAFPFDGGLLPVNPTNSYALSKAVGEQQLAYFAQKYGVSGVSLRFPWISTNKKYAETRMLEWLPFHQALAMITSDDAARLILAILGAELPGHRAYLPSGPFLVSKFGGADKIAREHYPEVPRLVEPLPALIDNTRITNETGWIPMDP